MCLQRENKIIFYVYNSWFHKTRTISLERRLTEEEKAQAEAERMQREKEEEAKRKAEEEARLAEERAEAEAKKPLDASIYYGYPGIEINNNEDKNWTNCEVRLNYGLLGGGFVYTANKISAKKSVTVRWGELVKSDGTRFNYFTTEPTKLKISCLVDGATRTAYFGN